MKVVSRPYIPPLHFLFFCLPPFLVLVPFALKCTWKLETYSVEVLAYEDSKILKLYPGLGFYHPDYEKQHRNHLRCDLEVLHVDFSEKNKFAHRV